MVHLHTRRQNAYTYKKFFKEINEQTHGIYTQSSYYSTPEEIKLTYVEKWSWEIKIVNKISRLERQTWYFFPCTERAHIVLVNSLSAWLIQNSYGTHLRYICEGVSGEVDMREDPLWKWAHQPTGWWCWTENEHQDSHLFAFLTEWQCVWKTSE